MKTDSIIRFLAAIGDCPTERELLAEFDALLALHGFRHYVLSRQPELTETPFSSPLVDRLPEGWLETYLAKRYHLVDPVLRYLAVAQGCYRLTDAFRAYERDAHRRIIARIFKDAARFGLDDGYVFPVYGRRGLLGHLIVCGEARELDGVTQCLMETVSTQLLRRLLASGGDGPAQSAQPVVDIGMTRREIEVLGLLAEGLTSNEIGRHLKISSHTVDWYVNGLQEKLGARNRQHAVSLALRQGLLA